MNFTNQAVQLGKHNATLGEVLQYLAIQNELPPVAFKMLPEGIRGTYTYPTEKYPVGNVAVDSGLWGEELINTLTHEITHAADRSMDMKSFKNQDSDQPAMKQFIDAFNKLSYDRSPRIPFVRKDREMRKQGAKKIDPDLEKEDPYRTQHVELPAFGVGNSAVKNEPHWAGKPHLDSTMATEFMILLDLARRAQIETLINSVGKEKK